MLMDYASPILTGVLLLVVLWNLRSRKASQFKTDRQHLKQSSGLFQAHAKAIERFLESSSAPISLKRILVNHSDAMSDRKMVQNLAQLIVNSSLSPENLPDDEEIVIQLRQLEALSPDLFSSFCVAMLTGTFAAVLRWPESAVLFEEISAKIVADPKRDVGMAITVSRIRKSDLPFSDAEPSPAMV